MDNYIKGVSRGVIPAGRYTKLACQRHAVDMKNPEIYFDKQSASRVINFFHTFLVHSKGEWAGKSFSLMPWQIFILSQIFGWKQKKDGTRRYRTAYIEIPRKNGKSCLAAGVGLYLFIADGEQGAEVYSCATKKDQAIITHSEATRMVKASGELKKLVGIFKNNLHIEATNSKYEPLGADADTMDGLNVHGVVIDELHAHKTRAMWDVMDTATGARRQPLLFAITTAGSDRQSVCWEQHEYATKILKGVIKDDTFFAFLACMDIKEAEEDVEDDWASETTWRKANPSYGVSVKPDDLRRKCAKAKESPASQNAFLRLHLNRWTQQTDRWISIAVWDDNFKKDITESDLYGKTCYGGLDLSSVSDMTAWVMAFPDDDGNIDIIARFWCPEDRLYEESNRYKDQYQVWHRQGFLETTPGNAIDYEFIKAKILEDAERFALVDLNMDRLFQAHQLGMQLQDEGLEVIGMGQGFTSMAAPMKEFERRLLARKLNHGGNPVLRWMADNVAVSQDPAGNIKINKAESQGKVDGIVGLVMAIDRVARNTSAGSVYNERGLLTL